MNLEKLNQIQQEAVQATEGRVRVIAGRGRGRRGPLLTGMLIW